MEFTDKITETYVNFRNFIIDPLEDNENFKEKYCNESVLCLMPFQRKTSCSFKHHVLLSKSFYAMVIQQPKICGCFELCQTSQRNNEWNRNIDINQRDYFPSVPQKIHEFVLRDSVMRSEGITVMQRLSHHRIVVQLEIRYVRSMPVMDTNPYYKI